MQENIELLQTHVRMVWRYRWLALAVAAMICLVGWAGVMLLPNSYKVTTKVFLDTRSLLRPLLRGLAVDSGVRQDTIRMMRRTLLSRPNLESVARTTDMDLAVNTPEQFEGLLKGLASGVRISGTVRDNIFVLSYSNRDPKLATRVVEALLNIFVERSLGESRKDTSKSREFLDQQIREYETKLEQAEGRLKEFQQRNVGMLPGEGGSYFSSLKAQAQQRKEAELLLKEAVNRRDELGRQLEDVDEMFDDEFAPGAESTVSHPLDGRIQRLEEQLDQLGLQYTDKHPDVISTKRVLERLKAQRAEDLAKVGDEAPGGMPDEQQVQNPLYQQLKVAYGSAQAEVAALKARVEEFKKREQDLKKLVDTVPKVEAELKALNRDYGVIKRNYNELVKRRESLKISDEAGKTTDDVQFNIIEPPRVPLTPSSPNRPVLSAAVLVIGLGAGVGLAWLVAMIRPAFYTKRDFDGFVDLPLLGAVSRISTAREVFRRRVGYALFMGGLTLLFGIFAGLLLLQRTNIDFAARLAKLGLPI